MGDYLPIVAKIDKTFFIPLYWLNNYYYLCFTKLLYQKKKV
ncbi:hypothetical protein M23134_01575 [Microscilla marina ATCC 23134]|uniref:Uncharacterized protein n=1 Tax=Microscilla marina ATCC 23134 TaxID=313606 RepID=A1ZTJ3_MICM2|nr:hypothetical protein M23134_01575 [Microscilla marina ATCC 23134]